MDISLYNGDCLLESKKIENNSVDLILTDLPYGVLNKRSEWDTIIPFGDLWEIVNRILKPNGAFITTSKQPFTSQLIMSNMRDFRYTMVWEKSKSTGYLNSKKMPLVSHEDIIVFYKKLPTYNPQMVMGIPYDKGVAVRDTESYGKQTKEIHVKNDTGLRFPRSVQYFVTAESEGKYHPTQKPIKLFEWLIKTYSNEGDVICDITMGSGTTGVAAVNTNRNFIGIEKDTAYFEIAETRIESVKSKMLNHTNNHFF
jgi:site-specific DNA-methyltransferase (adenine-specific)